MISPIQRNHGFTGPVFDVPTFSNGRRDLIILLVPEFLKMDERESN
jgi:hypothetical protein